MGWFGTAVNAARRALRSEPPRRRRATEVRVAADVEGAMLGSAAALRRLGATITRYEVDAGRLEARIGVGNGVISLAITAEGDSLAHMRIESDRADARRFFRRFRRELTRKDTA